MAEPAGGQSLYRRLTGTGAKFFRDFVILASGQTLSKILGFLAFAKLARALDPVSYGAVEYVVGLSLFFSTLVDGGLGVVGTRRAARNSNDLPLLAYQIPMARLMIAVIGVPVMALIAVNTMRASVPEALVWLFAASLIAAPWRQQWLFQATGRMAAVANAEIIRMGIFALGVWFLVHAPTDVLLVGWAEVAAVLAATLFCVVVQHRRITPLRFTGSHAGFGSLLKEGAAVGSTNFVWALGQSVPLFLIASIVGGIETALFAGGARISGSIVQFSNIYHFNLYPAVSRAYAAADGTLARLLIQSQRVTAWSGTGVALALTIFATPLIGLTLGPKLIAASSMLAILAWTIPVSLWSGHARWALAAAGAQKLVLVSQIAGLAATAAACIALGQAMGGVGYAAGTLAGPITVWVTAHRFAARASCVPPPFHLTLKPLLLAGATILFVRALELGFAGSILALLAFGAFAPLADHSLLGDVRRLAAARHEEHSVEGAAN